MTNNEPRPCEQIWSGTVKAKHGCVVKVKGLGGVGKTVTVHIST